MSFYKYITKLDILFCLSLIFSYICNDSGLKCQALAILLENISVCFYSNRLLKLRNFQR